MNVGLSYALSDQDAVEEHLSLTNPRLNDIEFDTKRTADEPENLDLNDILVPDLPKSKSSLNPEISISDILEDGMVPVKNSEDIMSQTGEAGSTAVQRSTGLYVKKIYTPKILPGGINEAGMMGAAVIPISADLIQQVSCDDKGQNDKGQDDEGTDDQSDEKEADISELASGD